MRITHGGALALSAFLLLGACGSNTEQRAATGGLGGTIVGGILGGPIGAVAGAAAGGTAGTLVSVAAEHGKLPEIMTGGEKETTENQGPTDLTPGAENPGAVQRPAIAPQ